MVEDRFLMGTIGAKLLECFTYGVKRQISCVLVQGWGFVLTFRFLMVHYHSSVKCIQQCLYVVFVFVMYYKSVTMMISANNMCFFVCIYRTKYKV